MPSPERGMDPLEILRMPCPNCQAQANQACTQPTETGRRQVLWYHDARLDAAEEFQEARREHELIDSPSVPESEKPAMRAEIEERRRIANLPEARVAFDARAQLLGAKQARLMARISTRNARRIRYGIVLGQETSAYYALAQGAGRRGKPSESFWELLGEASRRHRKNHIAARASGGLTMEAYDRAAGK